jgi:hypothetical protein
LLLPSHASAALPAEWRSQFKARESSCIVRGTALAFALFTQPRECLDRPSCTLLAPGLVSN